MSRRASRRLLGSHGVAVAAERLRGQIGLPGAAVAERDCSAQAQAGARRRGPHGAAVAVLVRGSRDERVRGGPLGVAAGAELRVRVQRAADPPAVPVLLRK